MICLCFLLTHWGIRGNQGLIVNNSSAMYTPETVIRAREWLSKSFALPIYDILIRLYD